MPDYPARTTRSGLKSNGGPGDGAILALDDANTPPIALSTALPSGIMLSQLPDSVLYQHPTPMDGSKQRIRRSRVSHDICKLVPRTPGVCTLLLGWVFLQLQVQ